MTKEIKQQNQTQGIWKRRKLAGLGEGLSTKVRGKKWKWLKFLSEVLENGLGQTCFADTSFRIFMNSVHLHHIKHSLTPVSKKGERGDLSAMVENKERLYWYQSPLCSPRPDFPPQIESSLRSWVFFFKTDLYGEWRDVNGPF